jgi:hypothetical protein
MLKGLLLQSLLSFRAFRAWGLVSAAGVFESWVAQGFVELCGVWGCSRLLLVGGFVSSEGFPRFQDLDEQQQQHEEEAIVESELLDFLCNTHTHTHPRTPGCHLPFAFLSLFLLLYSSQQRSSCWFLLLFSNSHIWEEAPLWFEDSGRW